MLARTNLRQIFSLVRTPKVSAGKHISQRSVSESILIAPDVKSAVLEGAPVVALESTIISHGLPYPKNLEVARHLEEIVRSHGCVPATTAILQGVLRVGLTDAELHGLAESKGDRKVLKASHRDIGYICAKKLDAGMSVTEVFLVYILLITLAAFLYS